MIKMKYKKREKYPDTFGKLPLTGVLHSRDSQIRGAIVRIEKTNHCIKSVRIRSYSGPHFPTFGLNTERY